MSGLRERRGRRWSEEDDNLLCSMAAARKSLTLMVAKLNRSMSTIKSRAQDLGVNIPGTEIGERRKRRQSA